MAIGNTFFVILALAALGPFAYDRYHVLSTFYTNSPSRLARVNTAKSYEIKFQDRLRSCEDAFLLEKQGLAILACDPGREKWNTVMGYFIPGPKANAELFAYNYAVPDLPDAQSLKKIEITNFPGQDDFHSLGMGYDEATSTLFIANHANAGPRIEKFKLDIKKLAATHVDTIQHPLLRGPNSIVAFNSEELLVSNDHYFLIRYTRMLAHIETYLGLPLGPVVYVNLKDGKVDAHVTTRVPFANGVEALNSTTIAIASTSGAAVLLYTKDGSQLTYRSRIRVPFLPDNLSSAGGKLLIAGHGHMPTTAKFAQSRHICNYPDELAKASPEKKEYCETATATSWVAEWTEEEGLKNIYVDTEFPSSTTFLRDVDRKVGIVPGLYAKGILVLKE